MPGCGVAHARPLLAVRQVGAAHGRGVARRHRLDQQQLLADEAACRAIDAQIVHARDYDFDYFGFKTLERAYLLRDATGRTAERPQYMLMRVALGIHGADLPAAFETYRLMSSKHFVHASPTLFNAVSKLYGLQMPEPLPFATSAAENRRFAPVRRRQDATRRVRTLPAAAHSVILSHHVHGARS